MIYKTPKCPECGEIAAGEVDLIPAVSRIERDDDSGEFFYIGDTDVNWDDQRNILRLMEQIGISLTKNYKVVTCGNHDWITEVKDE